MMLFSTDEILEKAKAILEQRRRVNKLYYENRKCKLNIEDKEIKIRGRPPKSLNANDALSIVQKYNHKTVINCDDLENNNETINEEILSQENINTEILLPETIKTQFNINKHKQLYIALLRKK